MGSASSARSITVTPRTWAGVPKIATPSPGNTLPILRWTAPTSDSGAAIIGYRLRIWYGSGHFVRSSPHRPMHAAWWSLGGQTAPRTGSTSPPPTQPEPAPAQTSAMVKPAPIPPGIPKIGTATPGAAGRRRGHIVCPAPGTATHLFRPRAGDRPHPIRPTTGNSCVPSFGRRATKPPFNSWHAPSAEPKPHRVLPAQKVWAAGDRTLNPRN